MKHGTARLASIFASARRGAIVGVEPDEALEAALVDGWEQGGAAWPSVSLEAGALAAYLGERAPPDTAPVEWLGRAPARDVFLACACCQGSPEAIRAFDTAFLSNLRRYLHTLPPTPELVAETREKLLEMLFVDAPGRPPKIRKYGGRGALDAWVRVAALRVALNLREAAGAATLLLDDVDEVAHRAAPGSDQELEFMKQSYRVPFVTAFREAMASLGARERNLLRFAFVEGLAPGQVAAIYGVHRTTAMRWIEAAQEEVLERTRRSLMERLRLSPSECDGVFGLVRSRIDVTLSSLLQTP